MSDLEKMKRIMKLKKIEAAIAELKYKVAEREQDILRIKDHIKQQQESYEELKREI